MAVGCMILGAVMIAAQLSYQPKQYTGVAYLMDVGVIAVGCILIAVGVVVICIEIALGPPVAE